MEPKKGIDHEEVGTEVSKDEDARRDITNLPPQRPTEDRADLRAEARARDEDEVADEVPGARDDDGTESTG